MIFSFIISLSSGVLRSCASLAPGEVYEEERGFARGSFFLFYCSKNRIQNAIKNGNKKASQKTTHSKRDWCKIQTAKCRETDVCTEINESLNNPGKESERQGLRRPSCCGS